MAKNKIQDLFEKVSVYDSKHIKNLSKKKVPQQLLEAVENGCSYETLLQLAKGYPVCKYQTQITVHGIFNDLGTRRVGVYVNLCKNKNQSLGIRWSAIDYNKKDELFTKIRTVDRAWHIVKNSQQFYLEQMVCVKDQDEYNRTLAVFKQKAASIDTSLFTGSVSAYGMMDVWGRVYVVLNVVVNCFHLQNMQKITENITGKDAAFISSALEIEKEKRMKQAKEYEDKMQAYERRRAEQKRLYDQQLAAWKEQNPIPESFRKVSNHTFQPGDIVLYRIAGDSIANFHFEYRVYYKSFGRLCNAFCDINGNRLGKGFEALTSSKDVYLKVV